MTAPDAPRVAICVPTCGRPASLRRLLEHLEREITGLSPELARVHVLVVDNGTEGEAAAVVREVRATPHIEVRDVVETRRGVASVRNRCLVETAGDHVIFLDDDEWPSEGWLDALLRTWRSAGADIVLGPARGDLPPDAPRWARASRLYDKDRRVPTGTAIRTAYSYNTFVAARVIAALGATFDTDFDETGSEDRHWFSRARLAGFRSVWCADAVVLEEVPANRVRLGWVFRRGIRMGGGAARSNRRLHGGAKAAVRVLALLVYNAGAVVAHVVGSPVSERLHWARGVRRAGITAGLAAALVGYQHAEYRDAGNDQRARSEGD